MGYSTKWLERGKELEIKVGKSAVYAQTVTGKGTLTGFNAIFKPSVMFNKEGVYSADIILNKEDGEKLYNLVKEVRTAQYKNFKKDKGGTVADITAIKPLATVDEETGEATPDIEGRWILKSKAKANIKEGQPTNKIAVFDAKGKPVKACKIGAGSTVRLKLDLVGYSVAGKSGVSIKLLAVQIINLVEYQGGAGSGASFDGFEVEDGYEFDETEMENSETTEASPVADDDDDWEESGI